MVKKILFCVAVLLFVPSVAEAGPVKRGLRAGKTTVERIGEAARNVRSFVGSLLGR